MRAVVAALIVAIAQPARADDDLAEAKRLEATLDYQHALAIVDRLIARGGAEPDQLVELHMMAGKLAAGLDHMLIAEDHFARVLAIHPDAALPDGTSPKITAPFYAARSASQPLHVTARRHGDSVVLAVEHDPLAIVAGISVRVIDAGGHPDEVVERHALEVHVPSGETVSEAAALDASGNRAWRGALEPAPAPAPPRPPVARPPAPPPSPAPPHGDVSGTEGGVLGRWTTWTAVGAVVLAAGGVAAWRFETAQDEWNQLRAQDGQHDYSQLVTVEDRGRAWGLVADIGFGLGAACGAVAVVELVLHRDRSTRIAVTPRGIGVAGRF